MTFSVTPHLYTKNMIVGIPFTVLLLLPGRQSHDLIIFVHAPGVDELGDLSPTLLNKKYKRGDTL